MSEDPLMLLSTAQGREIFFITISEVFDHYSYYHITV